jgi:four helix bundle protein
MPKQYDLERRSQAFARAVCGFAKRLPRNLVNDHYVGQLIRSCGSIGANYTEANDFLSKRDFLLHAKIARKEAREARYWFGLIDVPQMMRSELSYLVKEVFELECILGAIIRSVAK